MGINPTTPGNSGIRGPLGKSKVAQQARSYASYHDNIVTSGLNSIGEAPSGGKHAGPLPDTSSTPEGYVGKHVAGRHTASVPVDSVQTGGKHAASPSFGSTESSPTPGVGRHKAEKSGGGWSRVASFFGGMLS